VAEGVVQSVLRRFYEPHWRTWLVVTWFVAAGLMINDRWNAIRWFALSDTDDNLRMAQVRAWLEGQGWYDLRQYRFSPPDGADIHWSRLVDLPIAGIKLALAPFVGGAKAETAAAALAPMLPMAVAIAAVAVMARRLVSPKAFALAVAILFCAHSTRNMWMPMRIDHHGWQLAFIALVMMGIADPKRARGGFTVGIATALSLVVGMEMLPYLALAGAVMVLMWIWQADQAKRLMAYGVTLAGGCSAGYLLFASHANSYAVCDALSPVWLSAMVVAGALCVGLAWWSPEARWQRFAGAAAGGVAVAAAFGLAWPHCLGRLEQSSPELERMWLSKVREAMPIYRHGWKSAALGASLPVIGLIGYGAMIWRHRRDGVVAIAWAGLALLALTAALLLLWQTRATPAAQLLSIPGATALGWLIFTWFRARTHIAVQAVALAATFVVVSGLGTYFVTRSVPNKPDGRSAIHNANSRCPTFPALGPVARQPRGTVMTFVDLGPRLIVATHHDAIIGPYHRNAQQIIDTQRTWRGDAENALAIARRYGVDYLLICPNYSESTIYSSEAPRGFYMQLVRGQVPRWLEPVPLPANSPYRMWRVRR